MFNELLQRLTLGDRVWCVGHTFMKVVGCFDDYWYEYTEYLEDGASYFEITDTVTNVTAGYELDEKPWTVDQIVDAIYGGDML